MLREHENVVSLDRTSSPETRPPETKEERERRRNLGIYYTPPEAAMALARWAIRDRKDKVLEPSFGGCAMLSAAVSVFKILGNGSPSKQLYGYDVDARAFEHLAQMGINNTEKNFKKQDFLQSKAAGILVDAVLANPPFVSYHRLSDAQRKLTEQLRERYMPALPRLASLWAFFLLHSMSFLRAGGRMAFVLPNSIGTADYARPLLSFLQTRFSRVELVHVGERLFIQSGADERISLLLLSDYVPDGVAAAAPVRSKDILRIRDVLNEGTHWEIGGEEKQDPRQIATDALASLCADTLIELGSVASVQIGEVVGDIEFFVKPLDVWKRNEGIDSKYLFPLLTRAAQVKGVYAGKKSAQGGAPTFPRLLLPPEKRVPKAICDYLSHWTEEDIKANKTFEKRQTWYRCSYETGAHAFIGSMNHDFPRIIGNDIGISCSNSFYKIVVHKHPDLVGWLPLLCVSTPFRLSAEVLGRVRGSGGIKLEPSDVKKLLVPKTLPRLPKQEFGAISSRINDLIGKGEVDAAGQLADATIFLQTKQINANAMSILRSLRLALTERRLMRPD